MCLNELIDTAKQKYESEFNYPDEGIQVVHIEPLNSSIILPKFSVLDMENYISNMKPTFDEYKNCSNKIALIKDLRIWCNDFCRTVLPLYDAKVLIERHIAKYPSV